MHSIEQGTVSGNENPSRPHRMREFLAEMVRRLTWKGFLRSIALPLSGLLLFYGFVIGVRLSLGRWPHFGEQLSGSLKYYEEAVLRVGGLMACSLFLVPVFVIGCLFIRRWRHVSIYFLCYAVAVLAAFAAVNLAPGAFLNWFFD